MTTRSIRISVGVTTDSNFVLLGSPPAGWEWIVKTINIVNDTTAAGTATVRAGQKDGPGYSDFNFDDVPAKHGAQLQTWMILYETDQLAFIPPAAGWGWWISGTILPRAPAV